MHLRFTKMQGAGNDFVVLDGTAAPVELTAEQARKLGDRRFGVGADQILLVERSREPGVDFGYRIFNNSGEEVEHCGNGARCFLRYVRSRGLTEKAVVRVRTMNRVLELRMQPDGRVTVDMGAPVFEPARVPFDATGFAQRLKVLGVETRPFFLGMHEQPVYHGMGLFEGERHPVCERIARRGLYLPSGLALTLEQIEQVSDAVHQALR